MPEQFAFGHPSAARARHHAWYASGLRAAMHAESKSTSGVHSVDEHSACAWHALAVRRSAAQPPRSASSSPVSHHDRQSLMVPQSEYAAQSTSH